MERIKILIDTDIGSDIDDTWAIAYALCRERFDVKGICVTGRFSDYRAAIVCKLLRQLGREDVPVFKGIDAHGEEIRPQARWIEGEIAKTIDGDCAEIFERLILENPDLHIAGLAPNSTLAAVRNILLKYKVPVVAMAGSVRKGYFDSPAPVPECNVVTDLQASRMVYSSRLDYCMIPLDVCGTIRLTGENYKRVCRSSSSAAQAVMENYRIWNEDYVGGARKYSIENSSTILYDLAPFWYLEFPERFTVENLHISVTETGLTAEDSKGSCMKVATALNGLNELQALTARVLALGK